MESSRRDLFIDIRLLIGLSSKITKLRSTPVSPSYPKQVWNYLKQGLVFMGQIQIGFVGIHMRTCSGVGMLRLRHYTHPTRQMEKGIQQV